MKEDNDLDQESRNNLEAYVKIVWEIVKRKADETETKNEDENLRDEWEKRFKK